jgi:hypothetical protein
MPNVGSPGSAGTRAIQWNFVDAYPDAVSLREAVFKDLGRKESEKA